MLAGLCNANVASSSGVHMGPVSKPEETKSAFAPVLREIGERSHSVLSVSGGTQLLPLTAHVPIPTYRLRLFHSSMCN